MNKDICGLKAVGGLVITISAERTCRGVGQLQEKLSAAEGFLLVRSEVSLRRWSIF